LTLAGKGRGDRWPLVISASTPTPARLHRGTGRLVLENRRRIAPDFRIIHQLTATVGRYEYTDCTASRAGVGLDAGEPRVFSGSIRNSRNGGCFNTRIWKHFQMKTKHIFFLALALLSRPLLAQEAASQFAPAPSHAFSAGTIDSFDLQGPLPFSTAAPACGSSCGSACCDDCGACDSCDSFAGTRFHGKWDDCKVYGAIDYMLMHRTNNSYGGPIAIDTNNDSLLSGSDLDFNYESGVRATVGLGHLGYCCLPAWEVTYLGVYDWDESSTVGGNNNVSLAGDLGFGVVNGFTLAEAIRTEYETQVQSVETNYFGCITEFCRCDCFRRVEWLVGFRYLSLDEDLGLLGNNVGVADAIYNIDTDNNLYGAQTGGRFRSFRGCWGWELLGKAGIFGNDSSQSQDIVDELGVNDFVVRNTSDDSGTAAFVGEFGFSGLARLTCNSGLRCGYNLLWIEGVALAPDQLDFSNTAQSGLALDNGGGTFIHGFNFGLEYGW
jgi:hypothetical protein